jgi:hypothetical protein
MTLEAMNRTNFEIERTILRDVKNTEIGTGYEMSNFSNISLIYFHIAIGDKLS